MLHEYHLKLLHHFVQHGVVFLIVGGQARRLIDPLCVTKDLDIWVRLRAVDKPNLERALVAWAREHPLHTNQAMEPPLPLREGVQIAFPENDGVWFMTRAGRPMEINAREGVDILTSMEGMDFDRAREDAREHVIDGLIVFGLGDKDLKRTLRRS